LDLEGHAARNFWRDVDLTRTRRCVFHETSALPTPVRFATSRKPRLTCESLVRAVPSLGARTACFMHRTTAYLRWLDNVTWLCARMSLPQHRRSAISPPQPPPQLSPALFPRPTPSFFNYLGAFFPDPGSTPTARPRSFPAKPDRWTARQAAITPSNAPPSPTCCIVSQCGSPSMEPMKQPLAGHLGHVASLCCRMKRSATWRKGWLCALERCAPMPSSPVPVARMPLRSAVCWCFLASRI